MKESLKAIKFVKAIIFLFLFKGYEVYSNHINSTIYPRRGGLTHPQDTKKS